MALSNDELNARRRAREALNRDAVRAANNARYAANPEPYKAAARAYYQSNKEACKARMREYVANNRGRINAIIQNYYARKREAGGVLSADIRERLWVEQEGLCNHCGVDLSSVVVHLDHIYPVSKGGTNTDDNVQLLCQSCNARKGDKLPGEY